MRTEAEIRAELKKWDAVHEEYPDDDTVRAIVDTLLFVLDRHNDLSGYEE